MKAHTPWVLMVSLLSMPSAMVAAEWDPARVWPDYRSRQAERPLEYAAVDVSTFDGGERRRYRLSSQRWPDLEAGALWTHRVEVLVPRLPQSGPALLVINNGIAQGGGGRPPSGPTDFPAEVLETLVRSLGMAVVSIADVPPQAMTLPSDPQARTEDDLVAASWRRFLDAPQTHPHWPLQVPMAEAAIRAMDLADRELPPALRRSYMATGASKRAWTSWLLPLVDDRVTHLLPFVIDMNWQALAPDILRTYGGRWPVALTPYVQHGVTDDTGRPAFADLMRVVDPYAYLHGPRRDRLALPKMLVSASGDDFFPPDAARHYLGALPGPTALRALPNSDHEGIGRFTLSTLLPVLRRWRAGRALPHVVSDWNEASTSLHLSWRGSERPQRMRLWQAHNPHARDFRKACGIAYKAQAIEVADAEQQQVPVGVAETGWTASFIEMEYADGLLVTTPVRVAPVAMFPAQPPAEQGGRCRLVPLPPVTAVGAPPSLARREVAVR